MTVVLPSAPTGPRARRRTALRELAGEAGLDALLVTDVVNVRYLTGFTGSNAALLVGVDEERTVLATDPRYVLQARAEVPDLAHHIDRACGQSLLARLTGPIRVGFDSASVTVDGLDQLTAAAPEADLVRAAGLVERLRAVKDAGEVDSVRQACAIADAALAGLLATGGVRAGRTEREIARALEDGLLAHGADSPAFATIVAAGAHGAVPHHRPTDATLAEGDLVTMDFGALVDGYRSDMTRTVLLGPGADWQRELYALVDAAAAAGRAAVCDGAVACDVDAAARDVVADAGLGEQFVHGLGHGVGLAVHEGPALARTATGTLRTGMVLTVEPGVYLDGRGGVRIEDVLVVGPDGAEVLTSTTRDLLVLD